jgi:hypothetical protein
MRFTTFLLTITVATILLLTFTIRLASLYYALRDPDEVKLPAPKVACCRVMSGGHD